MKKFIFALILTLSFAKVFALGTFINKLGACSDEDGTGFSFDLFSVNNGSKTQLNFANKSDLTLNIGMLSGSIILCVNDRLFTGDTKGNILVEGYGAFTPVPQFSVVAGNKTKGKYAFEGARLYTTNGAQLVQLNPFPKGAGFVYNQTFDRLNILATANISTESDWCLNAGVQLKYEKLFSLGFIVQNALNNNDYIHFAASAGFHKDSFNLAGGYIYNYNNSGMNGINNLLEPQLNRNPTTVTQPYLPCPSSHVIKLSASYAAASWNFALDFLMGLTDDYVSGSLNGTLSGKNNALPVYTAALTTFKINEIANVNLKYCFWYNGNAKHTIYPFAEFKYDKSTFRTGAKITIDSYNNVTVSVPLMWTFMIGF